MYNTKIRSLQHSISKGQKMGSHDYELDKITEIWYRAILACEMIMEIVSDSFLSGMVKDEYSEEVDKALLVVSRFYIEKDAQNLADIYDYIIQVYRKVELQVEMLSRPVYLGRDGIRNYAQ